MRALTVLSSSNTPLLPLIQPRHLLVEMVAMALKSHTDWELINLAYKAKTVSCDYASIVEEMINAPIGFVKSF
jgi:hypothetical protein